MKDKYQKRYLKHQEKKKKELLSIMLKRHSDRIFSDKDVDPILTLGIVESISLCPSSCDRKAIYIKTITSRNDKELLSGLLVGGVGWIHRASAILLLFADPLAYKECLGYMPYLDAGVVINHLYLMATGCDLKVCYANPNVRKENTEFFEERYGKDIFCGAIALGY